jgi:Ca2+:H+ antiporter
MAPEEVAEGVSPELASHSAHSTRYHAVMLGLYGLPLILLAKQMTGPLDAMVLKLNAPMALSGLVMALLVLTPESIAAIHAARANHLQRSVNVLLGSVLASIGLTIPMVITVSLTTGRSLVLGLDATDSILLLLTLITSLLTFSMPRTNVLSGCVHLLLFSAYFMLLFDR